MTVVFANNFSTTLAAAIDAQATSLTLADATGWPAQSVADHAWVTLDDGLQIEIVRVSAQSGTTLTVTRGQDGTTATDFAIHTPVEMRVCAALLHDIQGGGTGTLRHNVYYGPSTITLPNLTAADIYALGDFDQQVAGDHDITIDGAGFADGWTAYIVTVAPSTLTRVRAGGFLDVPTFFEAANQRTILDGQTTLHVYSVSNQAAGIMLALTLTLSR